MMNTYITAIDAQVAARSLLSHPFYQAWTRGELSREALCDYATQYYHHVAAFPTYLSTVHAQTDDLATRLQILSNLIDEEAGHPNHPELWLQFTESLGLQIEQVMHAELQPETMHLIEAFRSACRRSTAEGLAALYAYESQIPLVAKSKIEGLKKFYAIANQQSLAYFHVHIDADLEHSAVERNLLTAYVHSQNAIAVHQAVEQVLTALWQMLSGVCQRHDIVCEGVA